MLPSVVRLCALTVVAFAIAASTWFGLSGLVAVVAIVVAGRLGRPLAQREQGRSNLMRPAGQLNEHIAKLKAEPFTISTSSDSVARNEIILGSGSARDRSGVSVPGQLWDV
jgi:hypothetical protein